MRRPLAVTAGIVAAAALLAAFAAGWMRVAKVTNARSQTSTSTATVS